MAKKNMELYVSRGTHESGNFAELTVEKKPEGKYKYLKLARTGIVVGWVILMLVLMFMIGGIFIFLGGIALGTGVFFINHITAPMAMTEYRYSILGGDMVFDKISGGMTKKEDILKIHIADMSVIAPYHGEKKALYEADDIVNRYDFCSTLTEPDIYFAIFEEDGKKSAVLFDATQKALKIMKFLNKEAVTVQEVRR